jgi:hypothetical protein
MLIPGVLRFELERDSGARALRTLVAVGPASVAADAYFAPLLDDLDVELIQDQLEQHLELRASRARFVHVQSL